MNGDLPRQKLREIVSLFGQRIITDSEKCERLLRDCCPEHRREINALVSALREGVVERLTSNSIELTNDTTRLLGKKLEDDVGVNRDLALWAVESWGIALNVLPETHVGTGTKVILNQSSAPVETSIGSSMPDAKKLELLTINPVAKIQNKSRSGLKWAIGLLVTALLGSGGVFGYQKWRETIEAQKAEEDALRQAEQAKKTANEQIREAALKAEEEQKQQKAKQAQEFQVRAKEDDRKVKIERERLDQARLENQRRQLDIQERQERARLENQQRQQELRDKQEQARFENQRRQQELRDKQEEARLENQRRQQELLEKQRQLQADRQREAQERAAQQQQQRMLQQGIDAITRGIK